MRSTVSDFINTFLLRFSRFLLQLHLVFYNTKYKDFKTVADKSDDLTVMGVFLKVRFNFLPLKTVFFVVVVFKINQEIRLQFIIYFLKYERKFSQEKFEVIEVGWRMRKVTEPGKTTFKCFYSIAPCLFVCLFLWLLLLLLLWPKTVDWWARMPSKPFFPLCIFNLFFLIIFGIFLTHILVMINGAWGFIHVFNQPRAHILQDVNYLAF